jgi:SAM-dependent methyltransferase
VRYRRDEGGSDYVRFPTLAHRNALQRFVEIPLLTRLLRLPRGCDVLEIGCGPGVALQPLARRLAPRSLVGVDIDAARVAVAQRDPAATLVLEADVRALPFADRSFDMVLDFGTLHHVEAPERGLVEVARVLRSGGIVVYETALAQALSHPLRFERGRLPWDATPELVPARSAGVWATRRKAYDRAVEASLEAVGVR